MLKQLLVPRLTCQLRFPLSPAEWAAILCGVGGAEQLEKLDVDMGFTNVSPSMLYIVDKLIEPWSEHSVFMTSGMWIEPRLPNQVQP